MKQNHKPWWRWLLMPLSPIAIPIGFVIGIVKGLCAIRNGGGDPGELGRGEDPGELEREGDSGELERGEDPGELELEGDPGERTK